MMHQRVSTILALVLPALMPLSGCDDPAPPMPAQSAAAVRNPLPSDEVRGDGRVRGRVIFNGTPPTMALIENRHCHSDAEPLAEEHVLVNDNGTLRNVFVYIEDAPAVDGSQLEPALLDQVHCRYAPHAIGIQTDQPLRIRSSDPTFHNVHWQSRRNPAANFGLTAAGQERTITFRAHEIVRVRCDVHPWMSAYIGVFDNPFFALTGEDGSFDITGLPEGEYTLVAWHETYGRLEHGLILSGAEPASHDFIYQGP
jgi:hypothetical protein